MDPEFGLLSNPVTQHDYIYANADPIGTIDPAGAMGLAGFGFDSGISINLQRAQQVNQAYSFLKKVCDTCTSIVGNVRHHVVPWFTRGLKKGTRKTFEPEELVLLVRGVHDRVHPLIDAVLSMRGLTSKSKGMDPYRALRSAGELAQVLDALIEAGELFDMACSAARGKYSTKGDVERMKHLLGR